MMNTNNTSTIHTKLYSKIALEVLQSVEGQLSDGMWENSPAMEKYWRFSNVTTAPDGEVLIEISAESGKMEQRGPGHHWLSNGFTNMNDTEIIKWFAAKVKHIMQTEIVDDGHVLKKEGWSRYNDKFETQYLSYDEKITVSDVYFVYDFLMGRDTAGKYSISQHQKIEGEPKSDEETKKEETRRQTEVKLSEEWMAARDKLDVEMKQKIQAIEDEYRKAVDEVNTKYKKLSEELQTTY